MDLQALTQALMGAVNTGPDYGVVNDTAANAAEMGAIRNLGGLYAQGDAAARASSALGSGAAQKAEEERQAAAEARRKQEEDRRRAQAELEYLRDPKNYRAVINDAGGYDFYDPFGGKISAREYAQVKNVQMTDLYKDSQDPNDRDFVDDYNRVMELGRIIQSGDAKARDKFYEKNPEFKEAYHDWTFQDIVKDLHRNYPGYFRGEEGLNHSAGGRKAMDLQSEEEKNKGWLPRLLSGLLG